MLILPYCLFLYVQNCTIKDLKKNRRRIMQLYSYIIRL
nr:MAG TPA: Heat shock cognate 71 kDa-protein complex, ATP-binding, Chaperone, Nucleotide-binding [Caudoviricetes sp.]